MKPIRITNSITLNTIPSPIDSTLRFLFWTTGANVVVSFGTDDGVVLIIALLRNGFCAKTALLSINPFAFTGVASVIPK